MLPNMAATPKLIFLVPSGSTSWQDQNRVQGDTDLPLSDEGQREVAAIAAAWDTSVGPIPVIYTAPDEASRQTGSAVAARTDGRVKAVDELIEINLGLWQGLTKAELGDRYRSAYKQWQEDPATVQIPHGENVVDVIERLESVVVKLISKTGSDPLVMVMRPVLFDLCDRWLTAAGCDPRGTTRPVPASPDARFRQQVRRFELDETQWRNPRALRQQKRISA
jgi:broad specificity phosphatase PhoE